MASNGALAVFAKAAGFDLDAFKTSLENLTAAQKKLALYWLLHDLLGARPEQETGVFDPDEFLYLWLVPVGKREALRYLEHPELLEQLERARKEPTVPHGKLWEELGILE